MEDQKIHKALAIMQTLIEQANAQGFFKQLSQLDLARTALNDLKEAVLKSKN